MLRAALVLKKEAMLFSLGIRQTEDREGRLAAH
jgi:hypothetical protein